ncbi:MAG TPA: hypothetical protein VLF89_02695 [Candidatus Saccharimonadales bacterium]|nr:hypothetical protein [Candidatus Saccharimonadales bacterium]
MKDSHKQQNDDTQSRVIDPSRNYSDMIGDTSGMTGMTTGSASESSVEPNDTTDGNSAHLPGGILQNNKQNQPTGIPNTAVNDKAYNVSVKQKMSQTAAQAADDIASDNDTIPQTASSSGNHSTDQVMTQVKDVNSPAVQGEQSVSGDMPDAESDDDTLENAQAVGTQMDEDLEHPEELDIARDIDAAEEYIRTH